ncbi:MAG: phthalate 4,5-dioxygenase [Rhodospirillales bacterium]|nr:phthalate 4,5-dioxygenase [Rhodospirillales bacterium]
MIEPDDDAMVPLTVVSTARIATDIHQFELARADGGALPAFTPGAHLRVRTPGGPIRCYSLSNDPAERHRYVIAVKREAAGRGGSAGMIDRVGAGDLLPVSAPLNNFELKGNPASYIFIAGGIGITPILSMIRHLEATGGKPFKLYYLTRSAETTAFRDELAQRGSKIVIHHDQGDPARGFDLWPVLEQPKGAHVYCCGPRGLMDAVRDMTGHWPTSAVHFEDFGVGSGLATADDAPFTVRLAQSGREFEVPADRSLLDTLRAQGVKVASSCESGTCGTCRTGLLAGEADHRDLVLAPYEQSSNIMVCVSRAKGGTLVLDL